MVVLNAIVLSLSHGEVPSHRRSAFPSISQELTRNASRKSGTPVIVTSPTVKCPMVQPQRHKKEEGSRQQTAHSTQHTAYSRIRRKESTSRKISQL